MIVYKYELQDEYRVTVELQSKRIWDENSYGYKKGGLEYYVNWNAFYWNSKSCDNKSFDTYDKALKYVYQCINN